MKSRVFLASVFVMALFAAITSYAQIPQTFSYQGVVTDLAGTPLTNGSHTILIRIYDAQTTPTDLWNESQVVQVHGGVFNVTVGSVKALTLAFDRPYYLGVAVDGGAELSPRTQLAAVPYALNARMAQSLAPGATGLVTSLNALTGDVVLEGGGGTTITKTGNRITITSTGSGGTGIQGVQNTDGSMTIQNGSGPVATINLAVRGIATDKLADNAVTGAKIASGQVVKSISASGTTLHDDVILEAGSNVILTPSGNRINISATGGSGGTGIQGVSNTNGTIDVLNPSGPVATVNVRENSINTVFLTDGAVTTGKLGDGAVVTNKIADGMVTAAKMAPGVIPVIPSSLPPNGPAGGSLTGTYPSPLIANDAVSNRHIADGAVTSAKIADGTITGADIATGAITADKTGFEYIASVDGVTNKGGNIDLIAGSNITITPDNTANTITISAATGGGGLTLPYSSTVSTSSRAFSITNSGTGGGAYFELTSATNGQPTLEVHNGGAGNAAYFHIDNTTAGGNTLRSTTASTNVNSDALEVSAVTGNALDASNSSSQAPTITAYNGNSTVGAGGGAIYGRSISTYPTAYFYNSSATTNAEVLRIGSPLGTVFAVDREGDVIATGTVTADIVVTTTNTGTTAPAIGGHYADNTVYAWAFVTSTGVVSQSMGGITCSRTGTGLYTITWSRSLTVAIPTVQPVGTSMQLAVVNGTVSTSCQVRMYGLSPLGVPALDDAPFYFTLMGRP